MGIVRVVAALVGLVALLAAACQMAAYPRVRPWTYRPHDTLVPWTQPMIRHAWHRLEQVAMVHGSVAMTANRPAARSNRARGPPWAAM
jgi:hypothetical protein